MLHYQADDAVLPKREKVYGYLSQRGQVGDARVSIFIDSGASFNAIDPQVASSLGLPVTTLPKPLMVKLGGGRRMSIPRRTSRLTVSMDGFKNYDTEVFVMDIPEGKNIMLGFPWLEDVNPDIDWSTKIIRPRGSSTGMRLQPCPQADRGNFVAGSRRKVHSSYRSDDQRDKLLFYSKHDYVSSTGETRVISHRQFRRMKKDEAEFCFAVRILVEQTDKATRQLQQGWDNLRGRPEESVVLKYKDTVFRVDLPDVAPQRTVDVEAEVELNDEVPVARKQFRLSEEMKQAIREWTKEMLAAGMIRPSKSPYCAPTFCVKKALGWRIVHDFRGINSKLRIPATPVPRKDDIYDAMAGGHYFSAMDLLWGFFQVRLREKDIQYTAFSTPDGQFEYLVTPMGLACSPSAFNRMIQRIFSDQKSFCLAYFDDLFVFTKSESLDEHLEALDKVLKRCEEQQLYIKLAKCTFCASEIPCLGDYFGRDGVRMDPDKVRVIRQWPVPRTKRQVQSFIGTCVYVLKYCENFAEIAAPLMDATRGRSRNEKILLSSEQLNAFERLKTLLSEPPVLSHPDHSRPFHVRMDASDYAVGGYLYQLGDDGAERVIGYGGRKLNTAEKMYPTREKELLAALHAMRLWRVYLIDKPFYVNTDHRTLQGILEQKTCSQRLARWLNELGSYKPLFRWIPGTSNIVADAVSRNPAFEPEVSAQHVSLANLLQQLTSQQDLTDDDSAFLHYMASRPTIIQQCVRLYPRDSSFGELYRFLKQRHDDSDVPPVEVPRHLRANTKHFFVENDVLYYQLSSDEPRRICVPDNADLRNSIFYEHHNSATSGHPGNLKTLLAVQAKFYWPRMNRSTRRYVASCEMCQRIKASHQKPAGLLHPLEIPSNRWCNISMDFITGLPRDRRSACDAIMVIVDRLTKRAHFVPTSTTCTAEEAARLFRDHHQKLHGLPSSIVSDRDPKFTSKFWSDLMAFQQTELQLSSAFRPETDGQTEKTNHFVSDYLRAFVNARHNDWNDKLSLAEFAYNARVHSSIGMEPFVADLGYIPRSVMDLTLPTSSRTRGVTFVEHQQVVLQQCKDMLEQTQATMKYFHDRNRPTYSFVEGDQVLLDTSNLDLHHLGTTGKRKLAPRYIGPYPIIASTTPDTYKIGLPPGLQLHDEFHVSYLRPYIFDENPRRLNDVPRLITREGHEGLQVQAILARRTRRGIIQYRVRWYGRENRDSWEPEANLGQARGLTERFLLAQPAHARASESSE